MTSPGNAVNQGQIQAEGNGGSDAPPERWKDLAERILQSIEALVTLNISTIVDDAGIKKTMTSTINLIDGDVTTEFDIAFVTGDLKELRDYQTQREAQGHQIIKDNIDALGKLIDLFKTARSSIGAADPSAPSA